MAAGARARVHAIDLLRLTMSLQMIQGHTIAALLAPESQTGGVYQTWTFARGLTAVGFLFAAGASYHQVLCRESDADAAARGRARRVRRALLLIAVGFLLRPPVGLASGDLAVALDSLDAFFAVDVLQCIGATLLGLEALRRLCPERHLRHVALALGLVLIAMAPLAAGLEAERPLRWLVAWLTRTGGSLFPLLPWSGFVLVGVAAGPGIGRTTTIAGALTVIAAGLAIAVSGQLWARVLPGLPPDAYYAWPPFSLIRLGLVVVLTGVLGLVSTRLVALPRWLQILARQTLALYVVHLLILHASAVGLVTLIGPTLAPGPAIAIAVVMIAVSAAAALAWDARALLGAPSRAAAS